MDEIPEDMAKILRAVWSGSSSGTTDSKKQSPPNADEPQNAFNVEVVAIPPGTFLMGSPNHERGRYLDEDQVRVTITNPFLISKTPVTQGQWKEVMGTEPWTETDRVEYGDEYPAVFVSWDDAIAFCDRMTAWARHQSLLPEESVFRLPTEAEWEYACRAGTTTAFSFGDDDHLLPEYGWFAGNTTAEHYAHRVKQKKPNRRGLFDMHGNVWEWCFDYYAPLRGGTNPCGPPDRSEPVYSDGTSFRVFRGGSWRVDANMCRSANRDFHVPSSRDRVLGFRFVIGHPIRRVG